MSIFRTFGVALCAMALSACVQMVKQPLDGAYHQGFHISEVTVAAGPKVEAPETIPELKRKLEEEAAFYPQAGPALRMEVTVETGRLATAAMAMLTGDVAGYTGAIRLVEPRDGRVVAEYTGVGAEYFGGLLGLARMNEYNNFEHLGRLFVSNAYGFAYDNADVGPKFIVSADAIAAAKAGARPTPVEAFNRVNGRWKGSTENCSGRVSEERRYTVELAVRQLKSTAFIVRDDRSSGPQPQTETKKQRVAGEVKPDGRTELAAAELEARLQVDIDPAAPVIKGAVNGCAIELKRQTPYLHMVSPAVGKGA